MLLSKKTSNLMVHSLPVESAAMETAFGLWTCHREEVP